MDKSNLNTKKDLSDESKSGMVLDLTIQNDNFDFASSISTALEQADLEIQTLNETIASIKGLKPDCDRLDYILAASSGAVRPY